MTAVGILIFSREKDDTVSCALRFASYAGDFGSVIRYLVIKILKGAWGICRMSSRAARGRTVVCFFFCDMYRTGQVKYPTFLRNLERRIEAE